MKKLLLSFVFLLVLAGLVSGAISYTASPTSLSVSGQEDLTFVRNISFTNTGTSAADNLNIGSTFTYVQANFQDKQGDLITFTRSPNPLAVTFGTTGALALTINIAENVKVGTYTGNYSQRIRTSGKCY